MSHYGNHPVPGVSGLCRSCRVYAGGEFSAAVHSSFVEDGLAVIADGELRDSAFIGDLWDGQSMQQPHGDVGLTRGESVGRHDSASEVYWSGGFDHDGGLPEAAGFGSQL